MANRRDPNDLPDISGVFQVDENDIPARVIKKPVEPQRRVSSYRSESVLSRSSEKSDSARAAASEENRRGRAARQRADYMEEQRQNRDRRRAYDMEDATRTVGEDDFGRSLRRRTEEEPERRTYRASGRDAYGSSRYDRTGETPFRQADREERQDYADEEIRRREQRQRAKQKRKLMRLLPRIVIPAVAVLLLIVILTVVRITNRPKIMVEEVKESSVENYVVFDAVALMDPAGTGSDRIYAVFVVNDYEQQGIAENNKVNLLCEDGSVVTGAVTEILQEKAENEDGEPSVLLDTIGTALPQTNLSADVNSVILVLPDDSSACENGESLTVQVVTDASRNVLTVPLNALRTEGVEIYVWVYKEKGLSRKIERRAVSVGLLSDETAEITDGLEKGEKVVVGSNVPPDELLNSQRVRLEKTEETTAAQDAAETEAAPEK